jgi:hypothetical protein
MPRIKSFNTYELTSYSKKEYGDNMYTVFTSKKKIVFSYKERSMWSCGYDKRTLKTAKEVFFCDKNDFTAEEKSIEEIHKMIAGGFVFFPVNEGTSAVDIKNYIQMGFNAAFLRAGDFKKFKKDYKDFI